MAFTVDGGRTPSAPTPQKKCAPGEKHQAAHLAVQYSLRHHLERKSVASDKEILATAIKSAIGKTPPEEVKEAFQQENTVLSVTEKLRTFITTKEALAEEKQLIRHCMAARNKFRPINETYQLQNPMLNEQQKSVVHHALSSTDGVILINGKAGTGKTTLMKEVQRGIRESGKQIFFFAPSSEASRGVQRRVRECRYRDTPDTAIRHTRIIPEAGYLD